MKQLFLLILLSGLCLSSCLTIEETYSFNANGSGRAVFQVSLTDMEPILSQATWDGSAQALEQLSFESIVVQLKTLEGLDEVRDLDNPGQHTWGVAFSFAHLLALNQALNVILIENPHDNWHTFFVQNEGNLSRSHKMNNLRIGEALQKDPDFASILDQTLQSMRYRMRYDFAHPIKVVYCDQELDLEAKRPNHLELEANFLELLRHPGLLDASVVLK